VPRPLHQRGGCRVLNVLPDYFEKAKNEWWGRVPQELQNERRKEHLCPMCGKPIIWYNDYTLCRWCRRSLTKTLRKAIQVYHREIQIANAELKAVQNEILNDAPSSEFALERKDES
jgi:predicted RNA-binding Zn-ribbon protein involved in translation (DUF1610 family)